MRKFILLLGTILGILMGQNSLNIISTTAHPGDTGVCVTINLTNQNPIGGIQFTFHYDQDVMTLEDARVGNEVPSGFSLNFNQIGDSVLTIIVSFQGDSLMPGSSEVANFYFTISQSAPVGDSIFLFLTNPVLASPHGTQLPVTCQGSYLKILPSTPRVFIRVDADTTTPGSTSETEIFIENTDDPVGGFQFTLNFPGDKVDFDTLLISLPAGFSLNYNVFSDSIKFVGLSLSGDSILPGVTQVGVLQFRIDPGVLPDDSIGLTFSGVIVSSPQAQVIPSEGIGGYIGISTASPSLHHPLNGEILNTRNVDIVIDPVNGAETYEIQYSIDSVSWSSVITVDTVYSITLPYDSTYFLKVRAITSRGYRSNWSSTIAFTVDATPPQTPQLISPVGGGWLRDSLVEFAWSAVYFGYKGEKSTPVRYILKIDTTVIDTVDTTVYISTVFEGRHTWRVKAFDLAGNESQWSPADSFGVDASSPIIDTFTVLGDTLRSSGPWAIEARVLDSISGVDSVKLYYRIDGLDWQIVDMCDSGGRWIGELPGLSDTLTHSLSYFVYAKDLAGNDAYSDTVNFVAILIEEGDIGKPKIIVETKRNGNIVLKYSLISSRAFDLRLYDVSGREVFRKLRRVSGTGKIVLKPNLKSGVYIFRLKAGEEKIFKKIVVVR